MANLAAALTALERGGSHENGLPAVYREIAEALDADHFYFVRVGETGITDFLVSPEQQAMLEAYVAEDWSARDDWTQSCVALGQNDVLMTDTAMFPPDLRRRSDFFQDFAPRWACGRIAAWSFAWGAERFGFNLSRADKRGSFDAAECDALRGIMANANRAAIAMGALAQAHRSGFADGLAQAGRAVILLDQDGRVCFVSPAAERLFCASFGVHDGRLFAHDAAAQGELDRLATRARRTRPWATLQATFRIPRLPDACAVLASASPVRLSALDMLPGARVLMSLTALQPQTAPAAAVLRAAFRLTPREAEIARSLALGFGIEAVAAKHGIKVETVRFYVKSLMAKTGAKRQAELVALIKELPPEATG